MDGMWGVNRDALHKARGHQSQRIGVLPGASLEFAIQGFKCDKSEESRFLT